MPSLMAPPSSWQDAILNTARQFMNGEVCFYKEHSGEQYDPITGTGGQNGITIEWRGKARIQHMRAPREFETPYQSQTSRFFRFQIDPAESGNGLPQLPAGSKARVIAGGRDSSLESLAFVVTSAVNSSHMAVRTVELVSNMTFIDWSWNPDAVDGFAIDAVEAPTPFTFYMTGDPSNG